MWKSNDKIKRRMASDDAESETGRGKISNNSSLTLLRRYHLRNYVCVSLSLSLIIHPLGLELESSWPFRRVCNADRPSAKPAKIKQTIGRKAVGCCAAYGV